MNVAILTPPANENSPPASDTIGVNYQSHLGDSLAHCIASAIIAPISSGPPEGNGL